jgi:CheY-like chemotaxis protein
MPPEVTTRAFEPFFTTKEVGKGTGLGLSQVYGLAKQLGGTARIESRVGEGTTVEIFLPRSIGGSAEDADGPPAGGRRARRRRATILVVDDDLDVRELTVVGLREQGYKVLEAGAGEEALAILDSDEPVDLLVVDYAMPGMTGAALSIEARARRPGLRILFVTGYADIATLAPESEDLLMHKPFRVADLAAKVAVALERPPPATTSAREGGASVVPLKPTGRRRD